jgi:DNA-binding MarR family transcriptional regulator/GNAT superfamily N-acetyltransferase
MGQRASTAATARRALDDRPATVRAPSDRSDATRAAAPPGADPLIEAVRRFNRFYTQHIGVLREGLLDSEFSLTELRVLYELAHADALTASDLVRQLNLDPGYVSRLLAGFRRKGLVSRSPSPTDARRHPLALTAKGHRAFAPLDRRSHDQVGAMLQKLSPDRQALLLSSMRTVADVLQAELRPAAQAFTLRSHAPGDIGWIIERHGALYAQEYDWDARFEALVAEIGARFIRRYDPDREHCWIAERDGERIGCVCVVKQSQRVAKLRLLLVEPGARGMGVGARLVRECVSFARRAGYRKLVLWTNSILDSARRLYEAEGFVRVGTETHSSFGPKLVGESWELDLAAVGAIPGAASGHAGRPPTVEKKPRGGGIDDATGPLSPRYREEKKASVRGRASPTAHRRSRAGRS